MANRFHYLAAVSVIVIFTGLGACRTVNTIERATPRAAPSVIQDARIITDPSLNRSAAVMQLNERLVANGLLEVQAQVLNRTAVRKRFNYRFDWFDDQGFEIATPLAQWKSLSLAGEESSFISSVAPTPQAVDFRLKLVEPSK